MSTAQLLAIVGCLVGMYYGAKLLLGYGVFVAVLGGIAGAHIGAVAGLVVFVLIALLQDLAKKSR